jgi:hypothetical protein
MGERSARLLDLRLAVDHACDVAGVPAEVRTEGGRRLVLSGRQRLVMLGELAARANEAAASAPAERRTEEAASGPALVALGPRVQPEVVELLRGLLEAAERGEVQAVAVALLKPQQRAATAWSAQDASVFALGFTVYDLLARLREEGLS